MAFYEYHYPVESDVYVKATSWYRFDYTNNLPYLSTRQSWVAYVGGNNWRSATGNKTNQRFNIDLGTLYNITKIEFYGFDNNATAKTFTIQGSNSPTSFDDVTYANDSGWTNISANRSTWSKSSDLQYALLDNPSSYRYYSMKIADNYGGSSTYIYFFRIYLLSNTGYVPHPIAGVQEGA